MLLFLVIVLAILSCFLAFLSYTLWIENDSYEEWTQETFDLVRSAITKMNDIDDSGVFRNDDEVGDVFNVLLEAVNGLKIIE